MYRKSQVWMSSAVALLLFTGAARAQNPPPTTVQWASGTSAAWADNANWATGRAPAATDAVWIFGNLQGDCAATATGPALAADTSISSLQLGPCAQLTISGATLTVTDYVGLHRGSAVVLKQGGHLKLSQASTVLSIAPTAKITPPGGADAIGAAPVGDLLMADVGFSADTVTRTKDPHSDEIIVSFSKSDGSSDTTPPLSTANTRMTVGIEENAASSSPISSNALVDLMVTAPILSRSSFKMKGGQPDGRSFPLLLGWLDARLSGVPQQNAPDVKTVVGGFQSGIVTSDSNETVQGIGVAGGLEIKLANGPTFGDHGHYQFEPTLVMGVGAQTPFVPSTDAPVFGITDAAVQQFQIPASIPNCAGTDCQYKYIAFVQPDRSRFLRAYFVGLRLKSHHFDCPASNKSCTEHQRQEVNFPGTIDVLFGQDEAVSGGEFHHAIMRLGGFYPLPFDTVANTFYLFGSMSIAITGNHSHDSLILPTPTTAIDITDPHVFTHTLTADDMDRDYWRLGVAVDIISLAKWLAPKSSATTK